MAYNMPNDNVTLWKTLVATLQEPLSQFGLWQLAYCGLLVFQWCFVKFAIFFYPFYTSVYDMYNYTMDMLVMPYRYCCTAMLVFVCWPLVLVGCWVFVALRALEWLIGTLSGAGHKPAGQADGAPAATDAEPDRRQSVPKTRVDLAAAPAGRQPTPSDRRRQRRVVLLDGTSAMCPEW